ncbi:nipblb [Symbiodinium sp. KB8]|nr:nipblb [Symbiodinium sp. KB8]
MGDVAVHIQLPPVLSPLREVLNVILEGGAADAGLWARLVAVGEALHDLVAGNTLAHQADVLLQANGGVESALVQHQDAIPEWYRATEAALNLVHAISALIPEENQGGAGERGEQEAPPWKVQTPVIVVAVH